MGFFVWSTALAYNADKLKTAPTARRKLAETAMRIGRAYNAARNEGRMPSPLLEIAHTVAGKLVEAPSNVVGEFSIKLHASYMCRTFENFQEGIKSP